jgi:hypothetical protein
MRKKKEEGALGAATNKLKLEEGARRHLSFII